MLFCAIKSLILGLAFFLNITMINHFVLFVALLSGYLSLLAQTTTATAPLPLKAELQRNFTGHQGSKVEYVTFSADGSKFATAGFDHLVHVVDIKNNTEGAKVLNGHENMVNHVAFNKSGTMLASASSDGMIKVWDIASGAIRYEFMNAPKSALFREAYFVLFSPDEKYLYFGGKNSRIQRVALAPDAKPESVYEDNYHITCAILSPDNRYLVFGCAYEVQCLDLNTQKIVKKFAGPTNFVNDIQISPDGKTLAAWIEDGNIFLWNYASAKIENTINAGEKGYCHLSFSKDGRYLASGNVAKNGFRLYDTKTQKIVLQNNEHQGTTRAMQFSPTAADVLLTGSYDGTVRLWNIVPNIVETPIPPTPQPPTPPIVQPQPKPQPAVTPPSAKAEPAKPKADIEFNDKNIPTAINDRAVHVKSNIPVRATHLSLEIFDDEQEDGDVVTIYLNDKLILEKHTLTKQKKVIPIEISATEPNVLILYAVNMGKSPPATVAIRILDGIFPQMINLSADPKESQAFNIFLKK